MAEQFDIVVIGSGAGALMAAVRAATAGASVVILEKQDHIGGTTARSGGGIWVPNNRYMGDAGVEDSEAEAFEYMRAVIPEDQVSDATIRMYIETVPKMLEFMMRETDAKYVPVPGYADYYPGVPGWKPGCRTMDCLPVDGRNLGDDLYKLQSLPPQSRALGKVHMSILEGAKILAQARGARRTMASVFLRYYLDIPGRLKGRMDRRLTMGNGLVGGLLSAVKRLGIPLRLGTRVVELVSDGTRVTGVVTESAEGQRATVDVAKAVIAAAGGFEHNDAMREDNLPGPTDTAWSAGSSGNTGDLIKAGKDIGAKLGLMNEAWWGPVVRRGRHPVVLFSEKSKPHLIVVDAQGKRFMNESITYNSYGECMYSAKQRGFDCVPAYVIFDGQYRQKYLFAGLPQSKLSPDWTQSLPGRDRSAAVLWCTNLPRRYRNQGRARHRR
jgi:3-oxosteroid 1-dehydrogenase